MTFGESCLPPIYRERKSHSLLPSKAHTLKSQDHGLSYWREDLRYKRPLWMKGYSARDTHRLRARELHEMCTD